MHKLSRIEPVNLSVYCMAGVATAPHFMEGVRQEIMETIRRETAIQIHDTGLLFPYGDWSEPLTRQIREIRHDMRLRGQAIARSIGCQRVLEQIRFPPNGNGKVLLVGHSGGGVTAVHMAQLLANDLLSLHPADHATQPPVHHAVQHPEATFYIVQIGSPKHPIPADMREQVLYMYAVGGGGKLKDPVCRLGSWGGWEQSSGLWGLPIWNRRKHSPAEIRGVQVIGGHADYFRKNNRDSEGSSNLYRVLAVILDWLLESWEAPFTNL